MSAATLNNQRIEISISAPGKVILHGEHAVVYEKLAVAASLGLRTKVKLVELPCQLEENSVIDLELSAFNVKHSFRLKVKDILLNILDQPLPLLTENSEFCWDSPDLIDQPYLEQKIEKLIESLNILEDFDVQSPQYLSLKTFYFLVAGIFGSLNLKIPSFHIKVATELKISAGTGSSASYAVTIAALFLQYARTKLKGVTNASKIGYKLYQFKEFDSKSFTRKELEIISKWALHAEKIIHGTPSGIDNTICTFGSMVEFRKGSPIKLFPVKRPLKILLVNSNIPRNTKAMVQKVANLYQSQPTVIHHVMDAIEEVSKNSIVTISRLYETDGDLKEIYNKLYELADLNHNLLASIGVSHEKLEKIRKICVQHGIHGKLTGAGGGGYFYAFIPPFLEEFVIKNLKIKLISKGFDATVVDLGGPGVQID